MINRFIYNSISAILLLVFSQVVLADASPSHMDKFLSVADIHFSPFVGCPSPSSTPCDLVKKLRASDYQSWDTILANDGPKELPKRGEETNYPLLKSALAELKAINDKDHAHFAVALGDFLAHDFKSQYVTYSRDTSLAGYQAFVKKTLQFLSYKIKQALPNIDIYSAVGNNDGYTDDYGSVPHGAFYQETARTWAHLIHDPNNRQQLLKSFPNGGYYAVTPEGHPNQRILVLNTVLFSTNAQGPHVDRAAQEELSWLHKQLALAMKQNQHVLLICHIPIGIDVYKVVQSKAGMIITFWKPKYTQLFENELKNFVAVITGILPAHIHMDAFQLLEVSEGKVIPVSFTPSISPIFRNNPGFKVFYYDTDNLKLHNFETYYFPLTAKDKQTWQVEYNFNQVYQSSCKTCDLTTGMKQVRAHGVLSEYFKQFYAAGDTSQPITAQNAWLPYYWCNLREIIAKSYKSCLGQDMQQS